MCGIIAAVGTEPALPVLLQGLLRQDERGYDSAGVALLNRSGLFVAKRAGKLPVLEQHLKTLPHIGGEVGIAHTRWATHGPKTTRNAHPHFSGDKSVVVVQNGVVENFQQLREKLLKEGFRFRSETDTEVIPHLIERALRKRAKSLEDAVADVVPQIRGNNGFVVMSKYHPDQIVAASLGSPLVVGFARDQLFLASAEKGLPDGCSVLHLADGEIVTLRKGGNLHLRGTSPADWKPRVQKMTVSFADLCKGNHEHFMHKEIMEQPSVIGRTLVGRLDAHKGQIVLGALTREVERRIAQATGITMSACGTSYNAALVGKRYFESLCRIPVTVELASEFQYQNPILGREHVLIGISQSGETMDTLSAVRLGKQRGTLCIGITNEPGSTLSHLVNPTGVFLKAGTEKAVASTKAFTAQVAVLAMMAIRTAQVRGSADGKVLSRFIRELQQVPSLLEQTLKTEDQVKEIASLYKKAKRVFFIGRNYGVPLAYEGALKLNEIAYVPSFGYAAGELKHGPIALVRKGVPVIGIVPRDGLEEKMISNLQEFKSKKGDVIALTTTGDRHLKQFAKHVIELPDVSPELVPMVYAPVLQLLAYHMGLALGCDIDKPINLAKTVTVE